MEGVAAVEMEWLGDLEARVHEAAERLDELREENRTLLRQVRELETRAATLSLPLAAPVEAADRDEELATLRARVRELEADLAAAETEREEVRRRVEKLVERLEELASA